MAGSYNHIINKENGKLYCNKQALDMLDCHSRDVYEALEEMYGMIWWLAGALSLWGGGSSANVVEKARQQWKIGLDTCSPGREEHYIREEED